MKKEQVLNLMNTVGPDLIEEADIQAPAKHRMPKAVRTGLAAACLCLALLGTAFAAANPEAVADFIHRFTPVQAETAVMGDGTEGFHFTYGITRYPMDSFSPALLAAGEGREEGHYFDRFFDTWAEVRAFIGEDIPCFLPADVESWGIQFLVRANYDQDGLLSVVDVGTYDPSFSYPSVLMIIATEYYSGDDNGMTHMWVSIPGGQAELLSPYSMANGCQAQITLYHYPDDPADAGDAAEWFIPDVWGTSDCYATFIQDGIYYSISGWPADEQMPMVYDLLDSFP